METMIHRLKRESVSAIMLQSLCSQRGVSSILVTFLLMLACFTAVSVANISQLMFEKTRLQNVADAAALAGATMQSFGLNEIADLNYEIRDQYIKLVTILSTKSPWHSLSHAKNAIRFFQGEFDYLRDLQDKDNKKYARWTVRACEKTIEANTPENRKGRWESEIKMTPARNKLTELSQRKKSPVIFAWVQFFCTPYYCPSVSTHMWSDAMAAPKHNYGQHDGSFPAMKTGIVLPGGGSVDLWREKEGTETAVKVTLTQRPVKFMMSSSVFGRLPQLKAHAKAKPTKGNIGAMRPVYEPRLVE